MKGGVFESFLSGASVFLCACVESVGNGWIGLVWVCVKSGIVALMIVFVIGGHGYGAYSLLTENEFFLG